MPLKANTKSLLPGYPPFYNENEPALFAQIRSGRYSFDDPVWDLVTDRCAQGRSGTALKGAPSASIADLCPLQSVLWAVTGGAVDAVSMRIVGR